MLMTGEMDWIKCQDTFDFDLSYIANNEEEFYFQSTKDAPRGKVVRYDLDVPVYLSAAKVMFRKQG